MKIIYIIRSILAAILFILATALLAFFGVILNIIFNRRKFDNWIMRTWGQVSCWLFNVQVQAYGLNHMKSVKGAIFLFNHSSFMDVLAMCKALPNIRFGAKIELFKIPLFGLCMRRFGVLPIARDNREEVFKVYEEAKIRFQRGEKFCLSPEGGRFHGSELRPFKAGPYIFAINAQVPLVPLVIKGAYEVWPKGKWLANSDRWNRTIEVHVLEPIPTQGLTLVERGYLQEKTYQLMNDLYKK